MQSKVMTRTRKKFGGTKNAAFFFCKESDGYFASRMPVSLLLSAFVVGLLLLSTTAFGAKAPGETRKSELLHMLRHDCGSCHGITLKGGLGPALTSQALANKPAIFLVQTILAGRPGTPMPPWDAMLTRQEVAWLVNVLKQGLDRAQ